MNSVKKIIFLFLVSYSSFIIAQTVISESDDIQNNIKKLDSITKHKKLANLKIKAKSTLDKYYFKLAEASVLNSEHKLKEAITSYYEAIKFSEDLKNDSLKGIVYGKIGAMYLMRENLTKALINFNNAFKFLPENKNDSNYVGLRLKKGLVYSYMEDLAGNRNNLPWLLVAAGKQKSRILEANIYNNAGTYFLEAQIPDSAIYYFTKSVQIREAIKNLPSIGQSYNNIGTAYYNKGDFSTALRYFEQGCIWRIKGKAPFQAVVESYVNIGKTYYKLKNNSLAMSYASKAYVLADSIGNGNIKQKAAAVLKDVYIESGNYKNALMYQDIYFHITDSMYGDRKRDEIANLTLEYETDQKLKQDSLKRVEAETAVKFEQEKQEAISKRTTVIITLLILFLSVVAFFAYTFFKSNKEKQKQNDVITKQHSQLQAKQTEINDSINYAKNIQNALLPPRLVFEERNKEYFIFFAPKDVVSGDFYWASSVKENNLDLFIYITADCTGHGVPGAFMSLICISFLNEIINEEKITDVAEILNRLRKKLIQTLADGQDGLDGLVCLLDNKTKKLNYAGANSRFFIAHEKDHILTEYKTDKMPVGKGPRQDVPFVCNSIQLHEGDIIYTFTDGYPDQFGGPKNKKLKVKNVEQKLSEMVDQKLSVQEEEIKKFFTNWKGDKEQIDDVTFIGIKV
ncbi:MAG: SpoIIE family protein phosphatase [Bacteroidetes bacterium]|nr:SpoIIE family protein phosphatase [Bacteroidota bacterium]